MQRGTDVKMGKPGLLFEGFISYLRRQGFIIGIDHHLRLHELLNKLSPDCELTDLKYLLCPIFAVSEKQQQQFYRTFDSYFKPLEASTELVKKFQSGKPGKSKYVESSEDAVNPPKWKYYLLGLLMVILTVHLISQWGEKPSGKGVSQKAVASIKFELYANPHESTITPPNQKPPESIEIKETRNEKDKSNEVITINDIFRKYRFTFRWLGLLGPLIVFLLIEGYKYNRRRLILLRQRGKKPPLVWPLKVDPPGTGFIKNDWLYRAAKFLRKRTKSDITFLDIEKTISESIAKEGYPVFRYKSLTQPQEYLILIDLSNYRDHYAHLWDNILTALAVEGVYVARYFYEQDLRVCFKEIDGQREYLSTLKTRYSDHRLIIFGDGEGLLDPLSGEMDNWTDLFNTWRERALLTPYRPKEWSRREIALAKEFVLAPATLEGLCALEDHWELPTESGLETWKQADEQFPFLTPGREEQVEELRRYLGKDTFQWLCSCAVYPELHWDLTLSLGMLPCMPGNLLNEENVLRLLRLPWFRTGTMPNELRLELISQLDTSKSQAIRAAIVNLLEMNPAPKESFAYENYRLNLVIQRWMLSREDRQKRKEAVKSLKCIGEKSIVKDYTMLRFLEATPTTPLHFVLPKRLRKLFYRKGVPFFGIKTGIRVTVTVLIAIASFLFLKELPIDMPLDVRAAAEKAERIYQNEKGFWEADYGNGIIMAYIPPGNFIMGQTKKDEEWLIVNLGKDKSKEYRNETPAHDVFLDGYWVGKTEVTNKQYVRFLNDSGIDHKNGCQGKQCIDTKNEYRSSHIMGIKGKYYVESGYESYPVTDISWFGAVEYCKWLSKKTGFNFNLPSEAQWEKAARCHDLEHEKRYYLFPWGDQMPDKTMANFYSDNTVAVNMNKGMSPYGLLNMAGNVWEWCFDWYDEGYYSKSPKENPLGPNEGKTRVRRGGGFNNPPISLRSAGRNEDDPSKCFSNVGFRLAQDKNLKDIYVIEKPQLRISEIKPGFEFIEDTVSLNSESFSVKMVRINQALYEFRVLGRDPHSNNALSLDDHQKLTDAICVLNGGFRKTFDAHETIGLLIIEGKIVNSLTTRYSGIFAVNNIGASIFYTKDFDASKDYKYALQGYPVIVRKGGQVSVGLQPDKVFDRTFVAVDIGNRIILGISTPVSLYQLATYLSQKKGLNCNVALNLEGGGGVSGMVIKLNDFSKKIDVTDYPVPNAIAVFSK